MTFSRRSFLTACAGLAAAGCRAVPHIASQKPPPFVPEVSPANVETLPNSALPARPPRPLRIGLALGGGAARGFAHIGVIKALEAQGIVADIITGTSAGSLVGALYASGNDGFALNKMALEMDEATISDWSVPFFSASSGVLKGEGLQHYVNQAVHNLPIEQLKKPFGAVAADLQSGAPILFRRGNTGLAVRASSAVPGVFQPVKIGAHSYVDGGLVSPVPVRFCREMGADFIIAVNISARPDGQAAGTSVEVLLQSFNIMGQSMSRQELKEADVVIQPSLGAMKGSDFGSRNLAILAGEQAAAAVMSELKAKLKQRRGQ